MQVFRDYRAIPATFRESVIAIGNFDGVHPGHRAVIGEAGRIARAQGLPWAVMSFEPHPKMFFRPGRPPFRLTPERAKTRAIADLGVDLKVVLTFDATLATMSAETFVREILVDGLKVRHVVCGYDFHFGKGRAGNPGMLLDAGHRLGFGFTVVDEVDDGDGHKYASTRIRSLLKAGDVREVGALLGRPFEIAGDVTEGDKRGRSIGFPTANIELGDYIEPRFGVYAVRLAIACEDTPVAWINGVANLGMRPTFDKSEPVLEVHLFDWSGNLYGRSTRVQLLDFIRPEQKFDGLDALKSQIAEDCQTARRDLAGI